MTKTTGSVFSFFSFNEQIYDLKVFFLKVYFKVYSFILKVRERESSCAQTGEEKRERERENPKQAPCCQHRG